MSRIVVFTRYGGPEVLHVQEIAEPHPSSGQVRVRVKAAGVQPFDCMFRAGLTQASLPATFPQQLGNEFSGIVDQVSEGIAWPRVGDEVLGWVGQAAYADFVIVNPDQLSGKPPMMPWGEAGVLSASGQTASTAIEDLSIGRGDTLLVHAASGGVGSFAVQLAVQLGATVIGTASDRNHDYIRSLGGIPVSYGAGLTDRLHQLAPQGITAALIGIDREEAVATSVDMVKDSSRIGVLPRLKQTAELGLRQIVTKRSQERLGALIENYTSGDLRVSVRKAYPLDDAAEAHRAQESGHVQGKLVLTT